MEFFTYKFPFYLVYKVVILITLFTAMLYDYQKFLLKPSRYESYCISETTLCTNMWESYTVRETSIGMPICYSSSSSCVSKLGCISNVAITSSNAANFILPKSHIYIPYILAVIVLSAITLVSTVLFSLKTRIDNLGSKWGAVIAVLKALSGSPLLITIAFILILCARNYQLTFSEDCNSASNNLSCTQLKICAMEIRVVLETNDVTINYFQYFVYIISALILIGVLFSVWHFIFLESDIPFQDRIRVSGNNIAKKLAHWNLGITALKEESMECPICLRQMLVKVQLPPEISIRSRSSKVGGGGGGGGGGIDGRSFRGVSIYRSNSKSVSGSVTIKQDVNEESCHLKNFDYSQPPPPLSSPITAIGLHPKQPSFRNNENLNKSRDNNTVITLPSNHSPVSSSTNVTSPNQGNKNNAQKINESEIVNVDTNLNNNCNKNSNNNSNNNVSNFYGKDSNNNNNTSSSSTSLRQSYKELHYISPKTDNGHRKSSLSSPLQQQQQLQLHRQAKAQQHSPLVSFNQLVNKNENEVLRDGRNEQSSPSKKHSKYSQNYSINTSVNATTTTTTTTSATNAVNTSSAINNNNNTQPPPPQSQEFSPSQIFDKFKDRNNQNNSSRKKIAGGGEEGGGGSIADSNYSNNGNEDKSNITMKSLVTSFTSQFTSPDHSRARSSSILVSVVKDRSHSIMVHDPTRNPSFLMNSTGIGTLGGGSPMIRRKESNKSFRGGFMGQQHLSSNDLRVIRTPELSHRRQLVAREETVISSVENRIIDNASDTSNNAISPTVAAVTTSPQVTHIDPSDQLAKSKSNDRATSFKKQLSSNSWMSCQSIDENPSPNNNDDSRPLFIDENHAVKVGKTPSRHIPVNEVETIGHSGSPPISLAPNQVPSSKQLPGTSAVTTTTTTTTTIASPITPVSPNPTLEHKIPPVSKATSFRSLHGGGGGNGKERSVRLGSIHSIQNRARAVSVMPTDFILAQVPCGHIFHKHCIEEWGGVHDNCPVCRADLTTGRPEEHSKDDDEENIYAQDYEDSWVMHEEDDEDEEKN